jgi:hypoxanthine phosphoribosyltransferase
MNISFLPVDWNTYHTHARKIAATVLSSKEPINQIVAISRGGLTFGHLLSDLMRIPIATFTIQSYTDIKSQGEIKITEPLKTRINGKHVLLVDDVADSGKTLVRAVKYLKGFKPASITVATMYFKPRSVFRPDYFADTTSQWILFPYEPTESIISITANMKSEKSSKAEIQDFLNSLGFSNELIKFTWKHHTP